jgi:hypothetical protein
MRYKDNQVSIKEHRYNEYIKRKIDVESRFTEIRDPVGYELEYKKRNVWSVKDIQVFLREFCKHPKHFIEISKKIPHKTSKELIFFFQTFKKLFNFKKHFRTCLALMFVPSE